MRWPSSPKPWCLNGQGHFELRFPIKDGGVAEVSVSIPPGGEVIEMCLISPSGAIVPYGDGGSRIFYPGSREGVVEELRRLIASEQDPLCRLRERGSISTRTRMTSLRKASMRTSQASRSSSARFAASISTLRVSRAT